MQISGILTSVQINEDRPGDSANIRVDAPDRTSRLIAIYGLLPAEVKELAPYLGAPVSIVINPDNSNGEAL